MTTPDWRRIVQHLETHPGSSGLEMIAALKIVEFRGRICDARRRGYVIEARKDAAHPKVFRYFLVARPKFTVEESPLPTPEPPPGRGTQTRPRP